MNTKYASWIIFALLLGACGMIREKFGRMAEGRSQLTVSLPQSGNPSISTWPVINGGILIYVVGVNGNPFATTVPVNGGGGSSATATITVPNGDYEVFALAWDNGPLAGQIGCGSGGGPFTLTGEPKSVNLTITNNPSVSGGCRYVNPSVFAYSGYNTIVSSNFPSLTINACLSVGGGGSCVSSATGSYGTNASVNVRMEGFVRNGNVFNRRPEFGSANRCTTFSSATAYTAGIVPPGNSALLNQVFGVTVELFPGVTDCSGTPNKRIYFPKGVVQGSADAYSVLGTGGTLGVDAN